MPLHERLLAIRLAKQRGICTPREWQVLDYWAAGIGIVRTARALGISESSVRTHRRRGIEKVETWITSPAGGTVPGDVA